MKINEKYYPSFKNHELILDLNLNAFSIYDVSCWKDDQTPGLLDYLIYPETTSETYEEVVTDGDGIPVTDSLLNVVTVERTKIVQYLLKDEYAYNTTWEFDSNRNLDPRHERVTFLFAFVTATIPTWGFSRYTNSDFRDWDYLNTSYYGFSYNSYLLTGYNLSGDMARQGQTIYLQTFCKRTESVRTYNYYWSYYEWYTPSACWVSSQWDWNNSAVQGKWSEEFNAYRFLKPTPVNPALGDPFDYGETVIITKNKLRGRGRALSLLFEAEYTKDLKLLGWNTLDTKNGEP